MTIVTITPERRAQAVLDVTTNCVEALYEAAKSFTCTEAEMIAELLRCWSDPQWAEQTATDFLLRHAEGDDDDGDLHAVDDEGALVYREESADAPTP